MNRMIISILSLIDNDDDNSDDASDSDSNGRSTAWPSPGPWFDRILGA